MYGISASLRIRDGALRRWDPLTAEVNPGDAAMGMAKRATALGAQVLEQARVDRLEWSEAQSRVTRVHSSRGVFDCGQVRSFGRLVSSPSSASLQRFGTLRLL